MIQIKKWVSIIYLIVGLVILFGNHHYIVGIGYGILLWFYIITGLFIAWIIRKKKWTILHRCLFLMSILFFVSWVYDQGQRIGISSSENTKDDLTILTYNLFFKNKYKKAILKEIESIDADIVLVQELTSHWDAALKKKVYNKYKYKKLFIHGGSHGMGILSKFPIRSSSFLYNTNSLPVSQINELTLGKKSIVVVNTHLASPALAVENSDRFFHYYKKVNQRRKQQYYELNEKLKIQFPNLPHIIAGDLNTMKVEPLYREMRTEWNDLFTLEGKGLGFNFPNIQTVPFPFLTLDYIFYRGRVEGIESRVLPYSTSDHLAVWGRVKL
ncbi:MAG: endonuclease/exonuclease/phosphatase family protein [Saprospiraceae bacterium]|nr:endonuclease/exonuclease/phosphatase family protein [Saprospiraceae bacterium]